MSVKLTISLSVACFALLLAAAAAWALPPAGEGRRIFLRDNCYGCHGIRAGGGMGPNLRDNKPELDDLREAIREGKDKGMPAFPTLTEQEIRYLFAYLQSLGTAQEPTFTHWWETTPSQ